MHVCVRNFVSFRHFNRYAKSNIHIPLLRCQFSIWYICTGIATKQLESEWKPQQCGTFATFHFSFRRQAIYCWLCVSNFMPLHRHTAVRMFLVWFDLAQLRFFLTNSDKITQYTTGMGQLLCTLSRKKPNVFSLIVL